MSQHDPQKYLHDMLECSEFLIQAVASRQRSELDEDRLFRSGVERELQIIGEALFKLNKEHPLVAANVPEYERIIVFRHILVHDYDRISRDIVWMVLQSRLPLLRDALKQLLERLDK